jgi:O-antigen/teichoic acid export membrane protein
MRSLWFGATLVTLLWFRNLPAVMLAMVGAQSVTAVVGFLLVSRLAGPVWPLVRLSFWRRLIGEGLPVSLAGSLEGVSLKADGVMVGAILGEVSAGLYAAAYNLYQSITGLLFAASVGVFPTMAQRSASSDSGQFRALYTKLLVAMALASGAVAVFLFASSDTIVMMLYGPEYVGSVQTMRWLALAIPFVGMNRLGVQTLNASGRQKLAFVAIAVGTAFNLGVNLRLIPLLGYSGAAITTVATEALVCLLTVAFVVMPFRRARKWSNDTQS